MPPPEEWPTPQGLEWSFLTEAPETDPGAQAQEPGAKKVVKAAWAKKAPAKKPPPKEGSFYFGPPDVDYPSSSVGDPSTQSAAVEIGLRHSSASWALDPVCWNPVDGPVWLFHPDGKPPQLAKQWDGQRRKLPARSALLRKNKNPRLVGMELEIAFNSTHSQAALRRFFCAVQKWRCHLHRDISIKPKETGYELVTSAYGGDHLVNAVDELAGALAMMGACVNDTCGYHVHVDAEGLSWTGLRRLIHLYVAIEPSLIDMVPAGRKANRHCWPCAPSLARGLLGKKCNSKAKEQILSNVYNTPAHKLLAKSSGSITDSRKPYTLAMRATKDPKPTARRAALNLHSYFLRGTVESRLAAGTASRNDILNWALLWAQIVGAADSGASDLLLKQHGGIGILILNDIAKEAGVQTWFEEKMAKNYVRPISLENVSV